MTRFALLLALSTLSAWGQAVVIGPSTQAAPYSNNYLYFNKMHWAGNWQSDLVYNSQDVVNLGGVSYVSLSPLNVGHPPTTSPTWWNTLPGSPGPAGPPAPAAEVLSTTFNFPPQTITAPLTAGVPATVTMTPCPTGLNAGTDVLHPIYLSVIGTPEAVVVTNGTCTSGAPTGTVNFTPAFNHAGGYAISSATLGIQEAINSLGVSGFGTGGIVQLVAGAYQMRALVSLQPKIAVNGTGDSTRILPASCSAQMFGFSGINLNVNTKSSVGLTHVALDASACDGINTVVGVGLYAGSDTTHFSLVNGLTIDTVTFINVGEGAHLERSQAVRMNHVQAYANSRFWFTDSQAGADADNHTFDIFIEDFTYLPFCPQGQCTIASMAVPVVEFDDCETCQMHKGYMGGGGTNISNIGIKVTGSSEDSRFDGVGLLLFGIELDIARGIHGAGHDFNFFPGFGTVINCGFTQFYQNGIRFEDGTVPFDNFLNVHDWQIQSNQFAIAQVLTAGIDFLYIGQYTRAVTVTNNLFTTIAAGQRAIHAASFVDSLVVSDNTFHNFLNYNWHLATALLVDVNGGSNLSVTGNTCAGLTYDAETGCISDNSGPSQNKNISGNLPISHTLSNGAQMYHNVITKIANGATQFLNAQTYTCVSATGCWSTGIIPPTPVTATAAQPVFVLPSFAPSNGPGVHVFLTAARIATKTACSGTTTLTASLGTPVFTNIFIAPYDVTQAPADTNFAPLNGLLVQQGSGALQSNPILVNFVSTGPTLDQVAVGCSLDVWLFYNVLP